MVPQIQTVTPCQVCSASCVMLPDAWDSTGAHHADCWMAVEHSTHMYGGVKAGACCSCGRQYVLAQHASAPTGLQERQAAGRQHRLLRTCWGIKHCACNISDWPG